MNCHELKNLLDGPELAASSRAAAAIADHLRTCDDPECARSVADARLFEAAVRDWRTRTPRVQLANPVVRELAAGRARPLAAAPVPRRGAPRALVGVACAALALTASIILMKGPPTDPTLADRAPRQPVTTPVPVEVANDAPAAPEAVPVTDEPAKYLSVAQQASYFVTDLVAVTLAGERDLEDSTIDADWTTRLQEQWHPVGDQIDQTVEDVLQVWPQKTTSG